MDNRDWPRALETACSWLAEDPTSLPAHRGAGRALANLDRDAEAQSHLETVLTQSPDDAHAHHLLALAHFHQRHYPQADAHLQRALELEPNHYGHWQLRTWMAYLRGAFKEAAGYARRTLELQPEDPYTLNLLALCQPHDHPAQFALYQRALAVDPENSAVHRNLGHYYLWVERDFAAAEVSLRRALHFNPTDKPAQQKLFLTLQHRHLGYKLLRLPWSLLDHVSPKPQIRSLVFVLVGGGLWWVNHALPWYLLFGWVLFVYPMQRVYEYLTLGDIRAEAGMPGAQRGGLLGYRRWPLAARMTFFAALTLLFWGACGGVYWWIKHDQNTASTALLLMLAVFGLFRIVRGTVRLVGRAFRSMRTGKPPSTPESTGSRRKNPRQPTKTAKL